MITLQNISKTYTDQVLFTDVTFTVNSSERIGLVGRNGTGKSTLLRIITGEEEPDGGTLLVPKKYNIGHMRQHIKFTESTVLDELCKDLKTGIEEGDESWKAKKILAGLGFKEDDLAKTPGIFSGGYQMRIELAKVLVSGPDMLLLDEPTNFLDIISIRWLESLLKAWKGELIVISHDRNFMDNVVDNIIGIHRGEVRKVKGSTNKYYDQIALEEEVYEKRRLNDEKKRKDIEEYINSFRAKARRAKSVQSSIKSLDRMEKFDKLSQVDTISFSFNSSPFRPPVVMEARDIRFSYDGKVPYLINGLDLVIERGDKICIAGANGKGKTTLARILEGRLLPVKGEVSRNPQVVMSFYEQGNVASLNDDMTVEEEITAAHPEKNRNQARNICGAMMFSGDAALKKIAVLSGGERSRVLLAKTLITPSNLLILDEPTHHLDMESCMALAEAVKAFDGAVIVVTHDEYFLDKVATKLVIFKDEKASVFPGKYSEFLERLGWDEGTEKTAGRKGRPSKGISKKDIRRKNALRLKARNEMLGPYEKSIENIEKKISDHEIEYNVLNDDMISVSFSGDADKIKAISKSLHEKRSQINSLYDELQSMIDRFEDEKAKYSDLYGEEME